LPHTLPHTLPHLAEALASPRKTLRAPLPHLLAPSSAPPSFPRPVLDLSQASLKTLKLRYIDPLERGTRGRAAAVESLAGYGTRMARIPLHAAKVSVRALEIRGEVLGDEAPHPDALPG